MLNDKQKMKKSPILFIIPRSSFNDVERSVGDAETGRQSPHPRTSIFL
jgi:hypothetical protein